MIGKQWVYFREKHTPQNMGCLRRWVQLGNVVLLTFMGWVISQANKWKDYSNHFGEGVEISKNWTTPLFGPWWSALELSWCLWMCHLYCWHVTVSSYWGSRSSWSCLFCRLGPIWFSSVYAVSFSQRFALSPAVYLTLNHPSLAMKGSTGFQLSRFLNLFLACKIWSSTGFFFFFLVIFLSPFLWAGISVTLLIWFS